MKKLGLLLTLSMLMLTACAQLKEYPKIKNNTLILQGDNCTWDAKTVHTVSIVKANKDGYKYWAYYGLDHYNDADRMLRKAGLIRSNDMINWEKYEGNPIINRDCRWPTLVFDNNKFYMFYAQYNAKGDSRIVMETSDDGYNFGNLTEVVPYQKGGQNQNPFIYKDPNDNKFYLYYYNGTERAKENKKWNIYVKNGNTIAELIKNNPYQVLIANETMAAPSIVFYKGTYYLLVEEFNNSKKMDRWVTNAFTSKYVDKGFKRVINNPVLFNNDACAFQYLIDGKVYVTYSHAVDKKKSKWVMRMIELE